MGMRGFFVAGAAPPNPVFALPVPANGTDGLRFAHRRAGGGETFFFTGYCHSIRWLPGLPGPDPGNFSLVGKVTKNAPGTPRTPIFAQSVCINGETALPLNFVLFLIYSLVVNDTPPAGLLKGDMFR